MVILLLPVLVFGQLAISRSASTGDTSWLDAFDTVFLYLPPLLELILIGAITEGVQQSWNGSPMSFANTLKAAARNFPTVMKIWLGIVVIAAIFLSPFIVAPLLPIAAAAIILVVGSIPAIIGGVLILVRFWVAVPIAIVERIGVRRSLSKSNKLTKPVDIRIFGAYLLLVLPVNIGIGSLYAYLLTTAQSTNSLRYSIGLLVLLTAVASCLRACFAATGYFALKKAQGEGIAAVAEAKAYTDEVQP